MEVWDFEPKNITQKPVSHFLFNSLAALVRHSQAQKCLKINPKPFKQAAMKEILLYLTESSTNWLTDWLTDWPASPKHNSTMERATGLIASLLNVTLSLDVPFCQLQQLHSKHNGATFVLLCILVLFADNTRCQFMMVWCDFF